MLSCADRATGARLTGSTRPVTRITLNGTSYDVQVKGAPTVTGTSAAYTLVLPDLDGVELDATLTVAGRATAFRITAVRDPPAFRLGTLDIPGRDLISAGPGESTAFTRLDIPGRDLISAGPGESTAFTRLDIPGHDLISAGPGESTAFTRLDNDSTRTADVFADITDATPADPECRPLLLTAASAGTPGPYDVLRRRWLDLTPGSGYDPTAEPYASRPAETWTLARGFHTTMAPIATSLWPTRPASPRATAGCGRWPRPASSRGTGPTGDASLLADLLRGIRGGERPGPPPRPDRYPLGQRATAHRRAPGDRPGPSGALGDPGRRHRRGDLHRPPTARPCHSWDGMCEP